MFRVLWGESPFMLSLVGLLIRRTPFIREMLMTHTHISHLLFLLNQRPEYQTVQKHARFNRLDPNLPSSLLHSCIPIAEDIMYPPSYPTRGLSITLDFHPAMPN